MQISVESWIIQDGNYPDFVVGSKNMFALEFWEPQRPLSKTTSTIKNMVHQQGPKYEVTGKVIVATEGILVLDFGILAYSDKVKLKTTITEGDFLTGTITLGIDYYLYQETLYRDEKMPAMKYEWQIESIFINRGKWRQSGRTLTRINDVFENINKTDAWNDDSGRANYHIDCKLLEQEPTK